MTFEASRPLPDIAYVHLPGEDDYVSSPVLAGLCRYESLFDGTLDLADIARMNDWLRAKAENEWRIADALTKR